MSSPKLPFTAGIMGRLVVEYIDGKLWRMMQDRSDPFSVHLSTGEQLTPPHRFTFDFASTPWILWPGLPAAGNGKDHAYGFAATAHDWAYVRGRFDSGKRFEKSIADWLFLAVMVACDVATNERDTMYYAVRDFGRYAWDKHHETHNNDNPTDQELQIT